MKRVLLWTLLGIATLVLGMATVVLLLADHDGLPAPDPAMPIHLADGTTRPLFEVVEMARKGEPLPAAKDRMTVSYDKQEQPLLPPEERARREAELRDLAERIEHTIREEEGSVFHLAEIARNKGRLDEAQALYLSIPEDDPRYSRARRRLAWDLLTKAKGQPRLAVVYANDSVKADPLEGNSWQDLVRVYGATLGFELD